MNLSQIREALGHWAMPNDVYRSRISHILQHGSLVTPRGISVIEQIGAWATYDCLYPVVTLKERRLNYAFMFAEAAWILSGSDELNRIEPYMRRIARFSDNGTTLSGAYGPPFRAQLPYVIDALMRDRDTRQAVMTLWRQSPGPSRDIPCTVSIQFLIRNMQLHAVIFMRSSDVLLGLPYDMFTFAMMTHFVALFLPKTISVGNNTIFIGSSHAYNLDYDKLDRIRNSEEYWDYAPINGHVHNTPDDLVDTLSDLANAQGSGHWSYDQFLPMVRAREWAKHE